MHPQVCFTTVKNSSVDSESQFCCKPPNSIKSSYIFYFCNFFSYLALNVTANCISEIHYIALDCLYLNTVLQLSSKEKKSQLSRDSNPGLLSGKQECYLCAMQPLMYILFKSSSKGYYSTEPTFLILSFLSWSSFSLLISFPLILISLLFSSSPLFGLF